MNLYEKIPSTYNVNNLRRSTNFTSAITLNLDNKPALSKFNQFRHANDLKRELPLTDKYTLQKVKRKHFLFTIVTNVDYMIVNIFIIYKHI